MGEINKGQIVNGMLHHLEGKNKTINFKTLAGKIWCLNYFNFLHLYFELIMVVTLPLYYNS